jgi:hypothetical protein
LSAAGEETLAGAVEAERQRLAEADAKVESIQAKLRALDEKRDTLVAGVDDPVYSEALQTIATADAQDYFETLVNEAKRTATPADDTIVRRIGDLNERLGRLDTELAELRKSARTVAERRVEVERARDRFRKSGYDHPDATFGNDMDLDRILGQILGGVVTSGVLWDLLKTGFGLRQPRGRPDRGGLSFPFPFPIPMPGREETRGGDWRRADSRGGWYSRSRDDDDDDDDDDYDDRRRGGFRTGGRF